MKRTLCKKNEKLFIYENDEKIIITNENKIKYGIRGDVCGIRGDVSGIRGYVSGIRGDVSGIRGYVSGIWGDASEISGDVEGIRGDVSGISGNIDLCELSDKDRAKGVNVLDLTIN